jgi:hypothetical protein
MTHRTVQIDLKDYKALKKYQAEAAGVISDLREQVAELEDKLDTKRRAEELLEIVETKLEEQDEDQLQE